MREANKKRDVDNWPRIPVALRVHILSVPYPWLANHSHGASSCCILTPMASLPTRPKLADWLHMACDTATRMYQEQGPVDE